MHPGALKALEFDRIVTVVSGLAVTSTGRHRLAELRPMTEPAGVIAALRATTEGTRFLASHPGFPLRAPSDLDQVLETLALDGVPLEPQRLIRLADYLDSIDEARRAVRNLTAGQVTTTFPILNRIADGIASFKSEIMDLRRKIDPSGEVLDHASPALASIRDRLRRQKARLRTTLESFLRGRDTSKYLQEQVITDRNGRHVLMVRAEHRGAIPGVVHGASTSGASLFLEPLNTVEINNDIVALEEQEAEEVRRVLAAITDTFRARPEDLGRTIEAATELDVVQARARFSQMVGGVEPAIAADTTFELHQARHPLLMPSVRAREPRDETGDGDMAHVRNAADPVPVDILLTPPARILLVTGPNTGGKTVALKTAGLLAAMVQSGLHIPVEHGSRLPVFKSLFADIGDEQSISASLSTFSAHITNLVSMDRQLALPALVLLDEIGAGTDPIEGGALGVAVIDHFRARGAHLIATTHYDSLKSYAATTAGVIGAAFGFDPETFAPTYRLLYGSPGRSLAIEIAARLGMPPAVIAAARENLSSREQQLAEHLARVDTDLRRLESERRDAGRERAAVASLERSLREREQALRSREDTFRRRLDARLDDQLREARREIDAVIEGLKARVAELTQQAGHRTASVSTGDAGRARAEARTAVEEVVGRLVGRGGAPPAAQRPSPAPAEEPVTVGARVLVGAMGLEGIVLELHGNRAEVDVRGKRVRADVRDLRSTAGAPTESPAGGTRQRDADAHNVKVSINLQPRETSLSELNVIGCTVDEALTRAEKFLDASTVTDQRVLRLIHGHGTGQLRRALAGFLREHPLVASFHAAAMDQGGAGVTIVELKD